MLSKMIKTLIIFISLILIVGCSKKQINYSDDNRNERIEIEFWYGMNGFPKELIKSYIEEFNLSQDKYFVIGVEQSDYNETFKSLKSAIARKRVPTVALLADQHLNYLALKGVLDHINDFKNEEDYDDFIDTYMEQNTIRENIMGIPMYGTTTVLFYRKDYFDEHDIEAVNLLTWESTSKVAKMLTTKKDGEVIVYGWQLMYGAQTLIDAAISNGGNFMDEENNTILVNSNEWVEAWDFFRKLIHEEKEIRVHYGGDTTDHRYVNIDDIMQGRTAIYIGSCGDRGELDSNMIGTYLLPSWENKLDNPRAVVNLYSLCIPIQDNDIERDGAIMWIKFLTSKEKSLDLVTNTGLLPVRKSSMDEDEFYELILENPDYFRPISQVKLGTKIFVDPTDGKIYDELEIAAYKVLVENTSAQEALDAAQKESQIYYDDMRTQGW